MKTTKIKTTLPVGNYMRKQEVLDYILGIAHLSTLGWLIPQTVRTYSDNIEDWLRVDDIQNIMTKDIFRIMECNIPTHVLYFKH